MTGGGGPDSAAVPSRSANAASIMVPTATAGRQRTLNGITMLSPLEECRHDVRLRRHDDLVHTPAAAEDDEVALNGRKGCRRLENRGAGTVGVDVVRAADMAAPQGREDLPVKTGHVLEASASVVGPETDRGELFRRVRSDGANAGHGGSVHAGERCIGAAGGGTVVVSRGLARGDERDRNGETGGGHESEHSAVEAHDVSFISGPARRSRAEPRGPTNMDVTRGRRKHGTARGPHVRGGIDESARSRPRMMPRAHHGDSLR